MHLMSTTLWAVNRQPNNYGIPDSQESSTIEEGADTVIWLALQPEE
jgi:hypothetical protein